MKTTLRIARLVADRDRREAAGDRIRICRNCGGAGRVKGKRPRCAVCGGRGHVWL